jgi:hypothetical protein
MTSTPTENNTDIEILLHKQKEYFEMKYPNLKVKYFKKGKKWYVAYIVVNLFGKFSKGFIIENYDFDLILKQFSGLERVLERTALYYFLKEKPKKNGK